MKHAATGFVDRHVRGETVRTVVRAAAAAGVLSGVPSTLHTLATGRDPLVTVRAAGTIAIDENTPKTARVAAGLVVHGAISVAWAAVLTAILPRRHAVRWGALAGLGIAALDLGIIARRYPAIADLPRGAQVADHVAFGAIAGFVFGRVTRSRARSARD